MGRQEVLDFILQEMKRLNEEEHVMDLCKAGRYEELSQIECNYPEEVMTWFEAEDNYLELEIEDIPDGECLALAIWLHGTDRTDEYAIFEEWEDFADMLADEAGELGKSIAAQMESLYLNQIDDFFTDEYADEYEQYIEDDEDDSDEEDPDEEQDTDTEDSSEDDDADEEEPVEEPDEDDDTDQEDPEK